MPQVSHLRLPPSSLISFLNNDGLKKKKKLSCSFITRAAHLPVCAHSGLQMYLALLNAVLGSMRIRIQLFTLTPLGSGPWSHFAVIKKLNFHMKNIVQVMGHKRYLRRYKSLEERLFIKFIYYFWSISLLLDPDLRTYSIWIQIQMNQINADPDIQYKWKMSQCHVNFKKNFHIFLIFFRLFRRTPDP